MLFDFPRTAGLLAAVILVGVVVVVGAGMMTVETTVTMVLPSMVVFGAIAFALGVKHGEYRATHST